MARTPLTVDLHSPRATCRAAGVTRRPRMTSLTAAVCTGGVGRWRPVGLSQASVPVRTIGGYGHNATRRAGSPGATGQRGAPADVVRKGRLSQLVAQ